LIDTIDIIAKMLGALRLFKIGMGETLITIC